MDEHKIFGTKIPRDVLLNKISLLAMLGPIREGQQEHSLTSTDDPRRGLTIDQEGEIVRNLSFLAYRRKDPHSVVALCIEEQEDGEGMTVRFSVNGDSVLYVKEGLQQICTTLEKISRQGRVCLFSSHSSSDTDIAKRTQRYMTSSYCFKRSSGWISLESRQGFVWLRSIGSRLRHSCRFTTFSYAAKKEQAMFRKWRSFDPS